jgi:hypothetical protein
VAIITWTDKVKHVDFSVYGTLYGTPSSDSRVKMNMKLNPCLEFFFWISNRRSGVGSDRTDFVSAVTDLCLTYTTTGLSPLDDRARSVGKCCGQNEDFITMKCIDTCPVCLLPSSNYHFSLQANMITPSVADLVDLFDAEGVFIFGKSTT